MGADLKEIVKIFKEVAIIYWKKDKICLESKSDRMRFQKKLYTLNCKKARFLKNPNSHKVRKKLK